MEERKVDRRILKTKKAIHNAYAELLKIKKSEDITIKDIADVADISRKTFYYYYNGVWEIEEEIENQLIEHLEKEIENLDFKTMIQSPYIIFERLTNLINTDLDFYGNLLSNEANSSLIRKISIILQNEMEKLLKSSTDLEEQKISLISKYCIAGMVIIFQEWFNSDRKISQKDISQDLSKVIFGGLNSFLEQK